jgi:hypothetical protein
MESGRGHPSVVTARVRAVTSQSLEGEDAWRSRMAPRHFVKAGLMVFEAGKEEISMPAERLCMRAS